MGMKMHPRYSSYIPPLLIALSNIDGDVLELGSGFYSTPLLHWVCSDLDRKLVTYENDKKYYELAELYRTESHEVFFVEDWDLIDIEKPWGVVLVDHGPGLRRREEIKRLANYAQCLVIHDSNGRHDHMYRYSEIYHLFKHKWIYSKAMPHSTILSNFVDFTAWDWRVL
jgi:hypothetical protein